jgi:hypothetical protein
MNPFKRGALTPSGKCAGMNFQKWQCPFTSTAQTECEKDTYIKSDGSKGYTYKQTRDYAVTVMAFYSKYKACTQ